MIRKYSAYFTFPVHQKSVPQEKQGRGKKRRAAEERDPVRSRVVHISAQITDPSRSLRCAEGNVFVLDAKMKHAEARLR